MCVYVVHVQNDNLEQVIDDLMDTTSDSAVTDTSLLSVSFIRLHYFLSFVWGPQITQSLVGFIFNNFDEPLPQTIIF